MTYCKFAGHAFAGHKSPMFCMSCPEPSDILDLRFEKKPVATKHLGS
jgi:hypothetical protein